MASKKTPAPKRGPAAPKPAPDKPQNFNAQALGVLEKAPAQPAEASAASPGFAPGAFVWAMSQAAVGKTVRRAGWPGLKKVNFTHPSGRVILENADFVATDWEIV